MGTQFQEVGHDVVLHHFTDAVLKPSRKLVFVIVNPAVGPKVDILFWEQNKKACLSASEQHDGDFIPAFQYRFSFDQQDSERLDISASYTATPWYRRLSESIGEDLKSFVESRNRALAAASEGAIPDLVGVNETGDVAILGEVKFEGLGQEAYAEVRAQVEAARRLGISYCLAIPSDPVYGSGLTRSWMDRNMPSEALVYEFSCGKSQILPKKEDLQFDLIQQ